MAIALSFQGLNRLRQLEQEFAIAYGVNNISRQFAVEPTIAQELDKQITLKSDFLQQISIIPRQEIAGKKVLLGINKSITGRTDTKNGGKRKAVYVGDLDELGYQLYQTNSDTAIDFETIDIWAKFPNFRELYSAFVQEQIALDRIKIGWNGTHAAANTDPITYPMLEDVNKGWLQYVREKAPGQILPEGEKTAGKILIGETGDFKNLDSLVYDVRYMLHENFRDSTDLVAIVGSKLLHREGLKYYELNALKPTEKVLLATKQIQETFGGLPTLICPFFPDTGLVVTSLDNLAIYWQENSWRRFMKDVPESDCYEDYISRNEGYVVQQTLKFAAIEASAVEFV